LAVRTRDAAAGFASLALKIRLRFGEAEETEREFLAELVAGLRSHTGADEETVTDEASLLLDVSSTLCKVNL
jgi:hypothetical protein